MAIRINCEFATVNARAGAPVIHCGAAKHGGFPSLVQCKKCKHFQHTIKGLGDRVERLAARSGVARGVEAISRKTGKDCGCNRRKEKLNQLFPATKRVRYSGEHEQEQSH